MIEANEQAAWLRFINEFHSKHWRPPTIREIQAHFEVSSTSVVNNRINNLINAGYLVREDGVSRGISITPDGRMFMESA